MKNTQRTIKFRAWDKERKEMVKIIHLTWLNGELDEANGYDHHEAFEIMQYTGLKDKNGKEIYEGDIVRLHCFNHNLITATIEWLGDGRAEFYPRIHDKEIKVDGGISDGKMVNMRIVHSWAGMHNCFSVEGYIEVIGNKYEEKQN